MPVRWIPKSPARNPAEEDLARLAKALGHPTRIRILRLLAAGRAQTCGELVAVLPLAQSTVSQHLRALEAAGLVGGAPDGPRRLYRADPVGLARLKDLIAFL
jgi:ArsR family transcriptional regulator